ncbi:MAG: sensor histidine kinase [Gammaproteobacteria bacterium]
MKKGRSNKGENFSFVNLFLLPAGNNNFELRNKLREIGVFYWACIVFIPYFIAEQSFAYQTTRYFPILIPLYALLALAPLIYRKTKNHQLYSGYVVAFGIGLVILLIAYEGGNRSPGAFWLMGTPLIFGLVGGSRGVWLGTVLMIATFIGFLGLNYLQLLPNLVEEHGDYEKEKLINLIGFGIYNVITSYYFIRTEEKARRELREQKQETDNLLHMLVHDVANPIKAIQLAIYASKKGQEDSDEMLKLVDETMIELAAMVQQVRKLRAIKDGKLKLTRVKVAMQAALADAVNLLHPQAELKGVRLELECDGEAVYVLADESLLKSTILANPISNSIKFSYPGQTVHIRLFVEPSLLTISIVDQGVGMTEKVLGQVFDPAASTSHPGTAGEYGTGYGMPLTKACVEELGGAIGLVSSQTPKASGTTVTISFPRCTV